jgi:hypothetical protein
MDKRSLIRCAVPKCDWGFKIKDTEEMAKCYEAFRLHCMQVHGLSRDDYDSVLHFDIEKSTLNLLKKYSK